MNIVFLDIDGVLNTHDADPEALCGQIHRDKVERINRVLRATEAKVVLSSAWRYIVHRGEASLAGMDWLLRSHGFLANRLIGVTRTDAMRENPDYDGTPASWPMIPHDNERGLQISEWIAGVGKPYHREKCRYVVVDDLDLGITEAGHPFVQTDGAVGLTDFDADLAIKILEA